MLVSRRLERGKLHDGNSRKNTARCFGGSIDACPKGVLFLWTKSEHDSDMNKKAEVAKGSKRNVGRQFNSSKSIQLPLTR